MTTKTDKAKLYQAILSAGPKQKTLADYTQAMLQAMGEDDKQMEAMHNKPGRPRCPRTR